MERWYRIAFREAPEFSGTGREFDDDLIEALLSTWRGTIPVAFIPQSSHAGDGSGFDDPHLDNKEADQFGMTY
jgi:hypothetical protein